MCIHDSAPWSKPVLYMMVGVPGSGKSSFARANFPAHIYVSRDEVRSEMVSEDEEYFSQEDAVYGAFCARVRAKLNDYGYCVADATHLSRKARRLLINTVSNAGQINFDVICIVMDTCVAESMRRNDLRSGRANVPHDVIQQMANRMSIPTVGELPEIKQVWLIRT